MAKHRTHSIEFKRQVVQEFLGGESLHALARRHGIAGGLDSDTAAADVLAEYEARIAALTCLASGSTLCTAAARREASSSTWIRA